MCDMAEMIGEKCECNSIPALCELWALLPPPQQHNPKKRERRKVYFQLEHNFLLVHDTEKADERDIVKNTFFCSQFHSICSSPTSSHTHDDEKWIMWRRRKMGWKLYDFMARTSCSLCVSLSYSLSNGTFNSPTINCIIKELLSLLISTIS